MKPCERRQLLHVRAPDEYMGYWLFLVPAIKFQPATCKTYLPTAIIFLNVKRTRTVRLHQVWKWLQWKFNSKTAYKVLYGRKYKHVICRPRSVRIGKNSNCSQKIFDIASFSLKWVSLLHDRSFSATLHHRNFLFVVKLLFEIILPEVAYKAVKT